ncbi:PASTA domain-containing protein, partial [bacterium]
DAATRIAQALSLDAAEVLRKLSQKGRFAWIKRRISNEEASLVRELSDPKVSPKPVRGLVIEGEGHRFYPGRELAGPVLGFVAPDGHGKDGLELALDAELRGHAEEIKGLRDRSGRLIFSEGVTDEQALQGHDVSLTIDEGIQHVAERELEAANRTYETQGGALVVVDPNTGEILALASAPGYNPNDYGESEVSDRRDRAISDTFEPGSVMKVFTVASALAAGAVKPTEAIFCEKGSFRLANVTIHDTHSHDWLTPTQILAKSSNIGALKIGLALGESGLYAAYRRFGFGEPTGLPLPGEAQGVLRPRARPWFDVETANASFGQGVSVTAVQLAMGFAAIANGGRLLEPVLVRKVTDAKKNVIREGATRVRREAVPPGVARMVAEMLTSVTEPGGTGTEAAVPGFRVAGKTGTAQKADPATGKYAADRFNASFVGFVPADRPRLVIAVVLPDPVVGHLAGDLAAPVFRRVAEASLRYLGVTPQGAPAKIARATEAAQVAAQVAAPAAYRPAISTDPFDGLGAAGVSGDANANAAVPGGVRVPDVAGMPARAAVKTMAQAGFVPVIEGSGRLARQIPAAGFQAAKGASVRLVFEPAS